MSGKKIRYQRAKHICEELCKGVTVITNCDNNISKIKECDTDTFYICQSYVSGSGLVIDRSGKYVLKENLIYGPGNRGPSFIVISANNVVLDLNDLNILYQGTTAGVIAIQATGSNITIKNGTIRDFPLVGILFTNSSIIQIENLNIINNGPPGGQALPNGSITSGGIIGISSNGITINNTTVTQNAGFGIGFGNSHNIYMDGVHADNNRELDFKTSSGKVCYPIGITLTNAPFDVPNSNVVLKNSTIIGNRAGNTLFGFSMFSILSGPGAQPPIENVVIENLQVIDNKTTDPDVEFNSGKINLSIGVITIGRNIRLKNVVVQKQGNSISPLVTDLGAVEVQGIEPGGINSVMEDCVVQDLFGTCNLEPMVGICSELFSTAITIKGCKVQNVINGSTVQRAAGINVNEKVGFPGIQDFPVIGVSVTDSIVQNIKTGNSSSTNTAGAGFLLNNVQYGKFENNISLNNIVGFLFTDFDLGPLGFSRDNVLEHNTAIGNTLFGFYDESLGANAYFRNTARASLSNYGGNIQANGNPIVIFNIPSGFITPPGPFDNISITA